MQRTGILLIMATLFMIITGCFQGEQSLKDIDPPQDQNLGENGEDNTPNDGSNNVSGEGESESDIVADTVPRKLYLMDVNGLIAEQILELPQLESKEVATQVLSYLVKGGPVTQILPNGFQAVLPEGTEILGLNLQEDGTLVVDLSEEFKEYEAVDELKILQAMTYTLTQFESVNNIQLRINGYPQDVMPVNGTPIGEGYSRSNGINIIESDTVDLINSEAVTMYFPSEYNDNRYYVPVTKYIQSNRGDADLFSAIVNSLLDGPDYRSNLTHVFNSNASLVDKPMINDGVLELIFNQEILKDIDNAILADEVMETLVRTLTEQNNIEAVEVRVENVEQLLNENGEVYSEPVTTKIFDESERL